jgi:hypothetical protein
MLVKNDEKWSTS